MTTPIEQAEILVEALPYIRRFRGTVLVVKYGGSAMTDAALKQAFADDIVLLKFVGMNPVVVHGGGPQIATALSRLGMQSRFVRGMRVTDSATMDVVEMVLAGQINKEIVALLNRHGGHAVGICGKDGGLIKARKLSLAPRGATESIDLGLVGDVVDIDPSIIQTLTASNFIPVIAPIGAGSEGQSFNINADLVAGRVAQALQAEKLVLLTDVPGILGEDGKLRPTLTPEQATILISNGTINEGMIPKVECGIAAIEGGVRKAHVIDGRVKHAILLEILTRAGVGTEIVAGATRRRPRRAVSG